MCSWRISAAPVSATVSAPQPVTVQSGTSLSVTMTGLTAGAAYTINVQPANLAGSGPTSAAAMFAPVVAPDTPSNTTVVSVGDTWIDLQWNAVPSATFYVVRLSNSSGNFVVGNTTALSANVTGLQSNAAVSLQVAAGTTGGLMSAYSTAVSATTVRVNLYCC